MLNIEGFLTFRIYFLKALVNKKNPSKIAVFIPNIFRDAPIQVLVSGLIPF